jgi:hypothetical protein
MREKEQQTKKRRSGKREGVLGEREGEQTSLKDGKRRSHEREGDPIRDPTQ